MQMRVEGDASWAAAQAALRQLPAKLRADAEQDGLLAATRVAASAAKRTQRFTDRSGRLRSKIRAGKGRRQFAPSTVLEAATSYAHIVERGRRGAKGRFFLRAAVEETRGPAMEAFRRAFAERLRVVAAELNAGTVSRRTSRSLR